MNAKELASLLNGREYRSEITADEEESARASRLVVVFGYSDDLIEFRGFVNDEEGGQEFFFDHNGWVKNNCDEDDCPHFQQLIQQPSVKKITSEWDNDGYSWTYSTTIPHETFDIMEDGEKYCRGIVFSLDDLKPQEVVLPPVDAHASDCATHNMPAAPNGACNCSADDIRLARVGAEILRDAHANDWGEPTPSPHAAAIERLCGAIEASRVAPQPDMPPDLKHRVGTFLVGFDIIEWHPAALAESMHGMIVIRADAYFHGPNIRYEALRHDFEVVEPGALPNEYFTKLTFSEVGEEVRAKIEWHRADVANG